MNGDGGYRGVRYNGLSPQHRNHPMTGRNNNYQLQTHCNCPSNVNLDTNDIELLPPMDDKFMVPNMNNGNNLKMIMPVNNANNLQNTVNGMMNDSNINQYCIYEE